MISCTEFIPAYSELFSYLDEKYGRQEVDRFWKYLFEPDGKGIPLIRYVEREGIRGCFSYWSGSLNEEAADFTMYVNEKKGFFLLDMHQCPSKGRLLKLKDEIGIVPYRDYCLHCDSYRAAVEKVGLKYIYNFKGIDQAACSLLIYDPKVFEGKIIIDHDTEIMERHASDNEYFHKDFHSSMNMGIHYIGENYGEEAVGEYLSRYTKNVYKAVLEDIKSRGLKALEDKIKDDYAKEKASEALETVYDVSKDCLMVKVKYCPAVKHLKETGREVSKWYRYTTEFVMETLVEDTDYELIILDYEESTGATSYCFCRKDITKGKMEVSQL